MTLNLDRGVRWEGERGESTRLPSTLPVALLLVLARRGEWTTRTALCSMFWPEADTERAQLNLRVNLHKARNLLVRLGVEVPIEADRRGMRWAPRVTTGEEDPDCGTLAEGFEIPEFERFARWLHGWRAACGRDNGAADTDDDDDLQQGLPLAQRFYGRRTEQARLRASTVQALVVAGEPGVGKSRLVAAALGPTIWLSCREGLRQASFGAVADLFATHPEWLEDLGAYRLDVARLLPDVAPGEPLPPLDALTARVRLFEALARIVERSADLIAVDDLQWADPASVEWLVMLAHRGRVRWVATARSEEMPASTQSALDALLSKGLLEQLPLQGLDRHAMNALLHDRRPDLAGRRSFPQAHAWLDAIGSYTGGNAFCAIELADTLSVDDRPERLDRIPLPERVALMVRRRWERLDAEARAVVDACALTIGVPTLAQLAAMTGLAPSATLSSLEASQRHGLTRDTACRHDVVREAVRAAILPCRAAEMHARAADYLARSGAEPEHVAHHWRAGGRPEAAWPWVLRVAQRLKHRGERDAAVAALREVRESTQDPALSLRAEIMLAQEHLFDDLPAGRTALESALARAHGLTSREERRAIEAHALAGLVDNAVFTGDLGRARRLARALRERLPCADRDVLIEAHQVLIEATMRLADGDAARSSLRALVEARTAPAIVLSFEAQIHWFLGAVREARRAFEVLLARHPEYCRGLTIENDLAVMCHALGDLDAAETMARRSLRSWAGNAHTEALSSLVLGSALTSMGRFAEAVEALDHAETLGRRQGSALFVGEALARRSRTQWCEGDLGAAVASAVAAREASGLLDEPLRGSGLALAEVLATVSATGTFPARPCEQLDALAARSDHPLVHARTWRARIVVAECRGRRTVALEAARRLVAAARDAGLLEWVCEGLEQVARWAAGAEAQAAHAEAVALASAQGFGWLVPKLAGLCAPRQAAT